MTTNQPENTQAAANRESAAAEGQISESDGPCDQIFRLGLNVGNMQQDHEKNQQCAQQQGCPPRLLLDHNAK